jgi:hypothetical protein
VQNGDDKFNCENKKLEESGENPHGDDQYKIAQRSHEG